MRTYRVWVDGRKEQTVTTMQGETGFQVRMKLANQYGVKTFQVISVWLK